MIITITNQKGGVAKTTTAVSIAHGLALRTQQGTLLVDLDQQGQSAIALGMMPEACLFNFLVADAPLVNCLRSTQRGSLDLLPGNARTKHIDLIYRNEVDGFERLCERLASLPYQHLVIDTPVSGLLQEAALHIADAIVVPARCESFSVDSVYATLALAERLNPKAPRVILPTMFDKRLNEHEYNLNVLAKLGAHAAPIPSRVAVIEAGACGKTIWEHSDASLHVVRDAYSRLLAQLGLVGEGEVQP